MVAHLLRDSGIVHVLSNHHLGRIGPACLHCVNGILHSLLADADLASGSLVAYLICGLDNSLITSSTFDSRSFTGFDFRQIKLSCAWFFSLTLSRSNAVIKLTNLSLRVKGLQDLVTQILFDSFGGLLRVKVCLTGTLIWWQKLIQHSITDKLRNVCAFFVCQLLKALAFWRNVADLIKRQFAFKVLHQVALLCILGAHELASIHFSLLKSCLRIGHRRRCRLHLLNAFNLTPRKRFVRQSFCRLQLLKL